MKNYFVHERALVEEGAHVGPKTRIWAFAHVLGGAKIGADCNICDHVFIENSAEIRYGDNGPLDWSSEEKSLLKLYETFRIEH